MKRFVFIFTLFSFAISAFATRNPARCLPGLDGAEAEARTAESPGNFTLPIGIPFGLTSRDTNTSTGKKDTASGKVIKGQTPSRKKVYQLNIGDQNSASSWRQTEEAFRQAQDMNADYILVHVGDDNAYSTVNKIKSRLYHYKTPVLLYVENKDKTSNSIIPLTKDTLTILKNVLSRNSKKAPVKKKTTVANSEMQESERQLTTPVRPISGRGMGNMNEETYFNKEQTSASVQVSEVLHQAGLENFDLIDYKPTALGRLIDLLVHPAVVFALVFLLTFGFYFQFRGMGNGFPLFIAVCSGLLLFASAYFEGLAQRLDLLLFFAGLVMVAAEIYWLKKSRLLLPGLLLAILGIPLAVMDPDVSVFTLQFLQAFLLTTGAVIASLLVCIRLELRLMSRYLAQKQAEPPPREVYSVPLSPGLPDLS